MENGLAITTGIGDISFWSIIAHVAMSSFAKEQLPYHSMANNYCNLGW